MQRVIPPWERVAPPGGGQSAPPGVSSTPFTPYNPQPQQPGYQQPGNQQSGYQQQGYQTPNYQQPLQQSAPVGYGQQQFLQEAGATGGWAGATAIRISPQTLKFR